MNKVFTAFTVLKSPPNCYTYHWFRFHKLSLCKPGWTQETAPLLPRAGIKGVSLCRVPVLDFYIDHGEPSNPETRPPVPPKCVD